MGFLDWLGSLFGGGQKSEAPPPSSSSSFGGLRPAPPAPPPMLARPAEQREAAPVPFWQQSAPAAPARQSAPSFLPAAFGQSAPAFSSFPPAAASYPAPAPVPVAQPEQAPPPNRPTAKYGDMFLMQSNKQSEQNAEQRKTAEAEEARSNYFGDQDEYAPKEMSVDQYLTLTPIQRAAVDANTALVQAAEQDVASWAKQQVGGKAIEDKDYLNKVSSSFGDAGGSDTYAPRTMAVLEDLGLDLQGKDLDQYLNHSALVTDADLKLLTNVPTAGPAPEDPRQQNAVAFAEAASNRLSETLAAGQTLLDSLRTGSDTGRQLFGAPTTTAPVGFTHNERDADLSQAFDILAQTRSQQDLTPETLGKLYTELETKHGVSPNEVAQYFETRLQANEYLNAAEDADVTLGGVGSSQEYLSPEDFRSKFLKRGE